MVEKTQVEPVESTPSDRKTQNTTLLFLGGVAIYLLFGLVLWWALDQYINPDNAKVPSTAKKDLFQGWGFIMAGVAAGVGIYFTWRSQRLGYETLRSELQDFQQRAEVNQELMKMNQERLRLTQERMLMQNFGVAVEQLGATDDHGYPRLEKRLGAIFSLEGLANSSQTLHPVVLQMLTAYVRENAPLLDPSLGEYEPADPAVPAAPTTDIQAILDVLGRREEFSVPEQDRVTLDLRRTDLRGAHLQGDLQQVRLYEAGLQGARLQNARLQNADLQSANLQGANLYKANLREANLQEAHLRAANLQETNLYKANLQEANLQGADLYRADLRRADLRRADLYRADLRRADLRELVHLTQDTQEQIEAALGDRGTRLPAGLQRPAEWSEGTTDQPDGDL